MFHPGFYIQAWEGANGGELTEMQDILNTLSAYHKQHFQIILEIHTYIHTYIYIYNDYPQDPTMDIAWDVAFIHTWT